MKEKQQMTNQGITNGIRVEQHQFATVIDNKKITETFYFENITDNNK
jgi:hypothetical protein